MSGLEPISTETITGTDLAGIDLDDRVVHDADPERAKWSRCGVWIGTDLANFVAPAEVTDAAWCPECVRRAGAKAP